MSGIAVFSEQVAIIREEICIGCTKCIQSCPTDAIIGSNKTLHTVITDACTGCGLCIPPCPVDCIDLIAISTRTPAERSQKEQDWELRRQRRAVRLENNKHVEMDALLSVAERRSAIESAVSRVQSKKK